MYTSVASTEELMKELGTNKPCIGNAFQFTSNCKNINDELERRFTVPVIQPEETIVKKKTKKPTEIIRKIKEVRYSDDVSSQEVNDRGLGTSKID